MKFVTNAYDYRRPEASMLHIYYGRTNKHAEWKRHEDWAKQFTIGKPKATAKYTVEQLENMNMIGLYDAE